MRYEMIFGDSKLFDGAPECAELVGHSGGFYRVTPDGFVYCGGCTFTTDEYRNVGFVAMRRIIREPKRWTAEDKKAGRLPEVGSLVMFGKSVIEFLGVGENSNFWACRYPTGVVSLREASIIKPLETPEEKAERLREEWFRSALRLINDEMTDACDAAVIYDALLSGALPVPTKGGE